MGKNVIQYVKYQNEKNCFGKSKGWVQSFSFIGRLKLQWKFFLEFIKIKILIGFTTYHADHLATAL